MAAPRRFTEAWLCFLTDLGAKLDEPADFQSLGGFVVSQYYGFARATRHLKYSSMVPHTRRKSKTQLPNLVKLPPQLCPAKAERYKIRTMVERVFSRLKDEFGANSIRVRGAKKVMAHLMFSVLALTVDQLLRLKT